MQAEFSNVRDTYFKYYVKRCWQIDIVFDISIFALHRWTGQYTQNFYLIFGRIETSNARAIFNHIRIKLQHSLVLNFIKMCYKRDLFIFHTAFKPIPPQTWHTHLIDIPPYLT